MMGSSVDIFFEGFVVLIGVVLAHGTGVLIGQHAGTQSSADHAVAVMDGDSLENHVEWLVAMAEARERKEKRK